MGEVKCVTSGREFLYDGPLGKFCPAPQFVRATCVMHKGNCDGGQALQGPVIEVLQPAGSLRRIQRAAPELSPVQALIVGRGS